MSKEFVFSATGSKLAFFKNNEVMWLHVEPSGKEKYEIKQDRTAYSKETYDPTGVAASNNGYSGGEACPPTSCYSQENSYVMSFINMGYKGMEILAERRNSEWLRKNTFLLLELTAHENRTYWRAQKYILLDNEGKIANARANAGEAYQTYRQYLRFNEGDPWYFTQISAFQDWMALSVISWQTQQQTQPPEPKVPKGNKYTKDQLESLGGAFREALARLQNPDCAALFTNWHDEAREYAGDRESKDEFDFIFERDPSEVLKNFDFRILPLPSASSGASDDHATGAATYSRTGVFINSGGIFFNRSQFVNGRFQTFNVPGRNTARLSQTQFAALLLLHELGHAYGYNTDSGVFKFFGPDASNSQLNLQYTQQVIDACFPEIAQH